VDDALNTHEPARAFLRAVALAGVEVVRGLLADDPALVNANGPHPFWGGRPQPLHVAIERDRRDVFDLLLVHGADVNGSNAQYDHWSPLMLAVSGAREEMRDELLRRGAHVGVPEALLMADDALVDRRLGEEGLPADVPSGGSLVAFARTTFAIDRLLGLGASVDAPDRWGVTPLDAFSRLGERGRPLVDHLARHGVRPTAADYARLGDRESLERVRVKDETTLRQDAVMMAAVDGGHHALVTWLLDNGASANARTARQSRQTALHNAAWNGDVAMVRLLVDAGADRAARDEEHHETPRGWAETAITIARNPRCREVVAYLDGLPGDQVTGEGRR
jgi:ankyrin repeat protein